MTPAAVLDLVMTGGVCPVQWEGTLTDGRRLYARARWERLTVGVGVSLQDAVRSAMSRDPLLALEVDSINYDLATLIRDTEGVLDFAGADLSRASWTHPESPEALAVGETA